MGPSPAGKKVSATMLLGQYELQGAIGAGGMGDVYAAVHTGLGKRVAIKVLKENLLGDEQVVARFVREGQLASRVRHPNIVDITDAGIIDGVPCLVMEHLEGEALSAVLQQRGFLPVTTIVDLLVPTIGAIEFAHQQGVLHRDIKPANIFLARSWRGEITPKILDFGISKLMDDTGEAPLTMDSAFVGTPHYAPPEVLGGEKFQGRSDQYSMGVVLYEGATGTRPFAHAAATFMTLALAIGKGECKRPRELRPELPEELEAVIMRAIAVRPAERFASMRELGAAVLPFASEPVRATWAPVFGVPERAAPERFPGHGPMSAQPMSPQTAVIPSVLSASSSASAAVHTSLPRATRSNGLFMTAIVMVAMILIAIGIVRHRRRAAAAAETEALGVVQTYGVEIDIVPLTASVEIDGATVPNGRVSLVLPNDGRKHVLRASAPDHETLLIVFDETRRPPSRIVLQRGTASGAGSAAGRPAHVPPPRTGGRPRTEATAHSKTDNLNPWP